MSSKTLTAAALLLAASATHATAQNSSGFYATGALGASTPGSWDGSFDLRALALTIDGLFDASPLARVAVGYAYNYTLRAEVELSFRRLAFQDDSNIGLPAPFDILDADADSTINITALMVNGLYDFDLPSSDYTIYVGAGLGMASVEVDLTDGPDNQNFVITQGDYTALAGQLRLGVERGMANGVTPFADYTYFHVQEREYTGANGLGGNVPQSFGQIQSHELAIGVRYAF